MARRGKYTKSIPFITPARRMVRRRWVWFRGLSRPKKILLIAAPFLAFLIITPVATYAYYAHDISNQERLMNRNNTGVVLLDRNGKEFYSVGRAEHNKLIPLSDIATVTQKALIASEDKNFYQHGGFSISSIFKALYRDVMSGNATAYGGSTLTQQLAKNTLLTDSQTFFRKYQELAVSVAIEQQYSKNQILDMYLNSVYFGDNSFGIGTAAKTYFNKSPKDLDIAESAMLIGVLPAPTAYSPITGDPKLAKERQNIVLTRMVNNGYITQAQKEAAYNENLVYAPPTSTTDGMAPHFAQMVLQQLYNKYGEEQVMRSGYQVTTTLDLGMQQQLQTNVDNHMAYIKREGGSNAGAVAIDPTTGEVRALVGSADWNNPTWGKVNMALTARQPGSSFKPIYYSRGLADGIITPATILHDVPTDFNGYRPLDADRRFRGDVTVRTAINESLNIPSVEVLQKVGIARAIAAAQEMGITTIDSKKNYGLSLALGSAEVPLLQMTNAYAAFANQGQQYNTTIIRSINNKFNANIYKASEKSKQVISPQGAYLISDILSDDKAKAPIFGSSLTVPGHTVAVKTGTTDNSRDAWTIGYTPQIAVGVWVGNNNNDTMLSGGSDMAGPIWKGTMENYLAGVAKTSFVMPSGIVTRAVCYGTGALATSLGYNTYDEQFLATALPTKTCSPQAPPAPVKQPVNNTPPSQTPTQVTPNDTTCPSGTTATPSGCTKPSQQSCPTGSTGTYPDCTPSPQTCPSGTTGTPPNCTSSSPTSPQPCPSGYTGTQPNCTKSTPPPSSSP